MDSSNGARPLSAATARTVREALGLSPRVLAGLLERTSARYVERAEAGAVPLAAAHAGLLLALECELRSTIERIAVAIGERSAATLIRYDRIADMLPDEAPRAIELHWAALAALRLHLGRRLSVVPWDEQDYRFWLGARQDSAGKRLMWASGSTPASSAEILVLQQGRQSRVG